jgi:dipeptidyl aminopeptidase/acylaminoacyl peptidase
MEERMRRRPPVFIVLPCLLLGTLVSSAFAAAKRPITEQDLFRFVWIADPQISPDGSRVAFVRVKVNEKKEGYASEIWMVSTRGEMPVRWTAGPRDGSPRWSRDGSRLVFTRSIDKDGQPQPPQLYVLSLAGGEAWPLTSLPKGAAAPAWSPDGNSVAFLSSTTDEDIAKADKKKDAGAGDSEHESDARVVTLATFREDDEGYADPKHHSHIWTVTVPGGTGGKAMPKPKRITDGPLDEGPPTWSHDGARIYFEADRNPEPYYELPTSALYAVPAAGGEITRVVSMEGVVGPYRLSPDGRQVAFVGAVTRPPRSYNQPHLFVADLAQGAAPRDTAPSLDRDVAPDIIGDQHAPRGGREARPIWATDGRSVVAAVSDQGTTNLRRFDLKSGRAQMVTTGNQEVSAWTATPDGSRVVVLVSTPTNIGDLFLVGEDGKLTRLTNVNQDLLSELDLVEPEDVWYQSFDGRKIETWVLKPRDFDPKKTYPLILDIHGGPHTAYGYTFFHEFQVMAARGYVVLYPNPRGSTTYGEEFGNIIQYHYPGDDAKDLLAGVDELVKRGYVDDRRLGVTGGSGGGILTNWIIGHTPRFAAAVSQRSIADWSAWWYAADFTLFQPNWFKGAPWEQMEDFRARSPLTYAADIRTPLMLIEGEADYRTPSGSGGEAMFRALKYLKRPVVMVRFPGESHELSRSGGPWHRVERLQHILNWFDMHLQGKQLHLYDVPGTEEPKKTTSAAGGSPVWAGSMP